MVINVVCCLLYCSIGCVVNLSFMDMVFVIDCKYCNWYGSTWCYKPHTSIVVTTIHGHTQWPCYHLLSDSVNTKANCEMQSNFQLHLFSSLAHYGQKSLISTPISKCKTDLPTLPIFGWNLHFFLIKYTGASLIFGW